MYTWCQLLGKRLQKQTLARLFMHFMHSLIAYSAYTPPKKKTILNKQRDRLTSLCQTVPIEYDRIKKQE